MLELFISEKDFYDSSSNRLIETPSCIVTLEHSLISLAKWESKWQIPFLDGIEKTTTQNTDYIRCMVVGQIKDPLIFDTLSTNELTQIQTYMQSPMTATTFSRVSTTSKTKTKKEIMTAEVLYAHMFAYRISMDCQKWHLNRLLTLIKVCSLQNEQPEKMTKKQSAVWAAEQNAARQAKYNTRG